MNMGDFLAMIRQNTRSEPLVLRAFDAIGVPLMWLASIALGLSAIAQIVIALARWMHGVHAS